MILELDPTTSARCSSGSASTRSCSRRCARRVATGELSAATNVVTGRRRAARRRGPRATPGAGLGRMARRRARPGCGRSPAGRVAQVVLAGGMATRFGGVVKGAVEALDGRSFLVVEARGDAAPRRRARRRDPRRADDELHDRRTRRAPTSQGSTCPSRLWFSQFVSLRLTESGDVFLEEGGSVAVRTWPRRPARGDPPLGHARRASRDGASSTSRSRTSTTSAPGSIPSSSGRTCSPGGPMTSEVARKGGDMGGAPARVDGRLGLLEGPQFPPDFDQSRIPVFNTNTATLDARGARPRLRPALALRPEVGRRPHGDPARAPVPPRLVGARHDVPRGAAYAARVAGSSRSRSPRTSTRSRDALREMLAASVLD